MSNVWYPFPPEPRKPRSGEIRVSWMTTISGGSRDGEPHEHVEFWAPPELPIYCPKCGRQDTTYECVEGMITEEAEYYICIDCLYDWHGIFQTLGYYGITEVGKRALKIKGGGGERPTGP